MTEPAKYIVTITVDRGLRLKIIDSPFEAYLYPGFFICSEYPNVKCVSDDIENGVTYVKSLCFRAIGAFKIVPEKIEFVIDDRTQA